MKHSTKHHFVQAEENGKIKIVGHSTDKKTNEVYYKFMDKKQAVSLMEAERLVAPEFKYRVCSVTETIEFTPFK